MKVSVALLVLLSLSVVDSMQLKCLFTMTSDNLYSCTNHDLKIEKNGVEINEVKGHHPDGRHNHDVTAIYFLSAGMKRLPRNVFKVFKNLSKYVVHGLDTVSDYLESEALVNQDFWGAKSLESLFFTSVVLEQLRARVFEGAENLAYMTLEACHITTIDKETFKGLRKLQSLGLKYNYITTLDEATFSDLTGLQHLLLSGNFLATISSEHFKALKNLNRLALIGNLLTEVDEDLIDDLEHLEFLYLDQNVCIDEHFGTDGVPFSKFKTIISHCSREQSVDEVLKKKQSEILLLEKEIMLLQSLVEKYRRGGNRDELVNKIKEMP